MDKNIDEVKLTDIGLTVNDIKSNNKKEKPSIVTFKQFAKMLRNKSTQDISPTAYAHAASSDYKIDESKSEKCKDCGSEDCHCELSDKEIDDLVNSVSDEDFADLYEPNEFAEVDEDGKPLKESLDEASDMKKVVVRYKPKGASTPIEHVYVVPKTATEKDVIALHKRSFGGGIGGVRTQNESEQINEVLSREERIRQAARFAMTQSRRDRKRQIALHRFSGGKVIAKRARRMAVSILKKRMMKGRDISKLSIGEKERLEARIQRMKNTVARIAVRLTSKIRKIEKERMSHPKYTKKD